MSHRSLKELYQKVFEQVKVHPQIQGCQRGLLYNIILVILKEEELREHEKTDEICAPLGIQPYSRQEADYEIIANLIEELFIDRQFLARLIPGIGVITNFSVRFNNFMTYFINREEKMKWFVVAACTLVGVYFCIQYLKGNQERELNQQRQIEPINPQPVSLPQIEAALCLVVPASIASDFQKASRISVDTVKELIDGASYFLCVSYKNIENTEKYLQTVSEAILPESEREVYVRIKINDGRDLIGKDTRYRLKMNMPHNAECDIEKVICLSDLSGLEVFNRV